MSSPQLPLAAPALASPALALPFAYNAAVAFLDDAVARGWGERVALRTASATHTYAQLAEQANRAGNVLRALGVDLEQRVAILLYDSPEFAATFFGAIKVGAVAVPLNTQMRSQDYVYMLEDSRARVLVVEERSVAAARPTPPRPALLAARGRRGAAAALSRRIPRPTPSRR